VEEARKTKVGDQAEDFTLKDQNEKEFKLSQSKGKRVLLSFHPLAWTSVCAKQMQSLEANKEVFDSLTPWRSDSALTRCPQKQPGRIAWG